MGKAGCPKGGPYASSVLGPWGLAWRPTPSVRVVITCMPDFLARREHDPRQPTGPRPKRASIEQLHPLLRLQRMAGNQAVTSLLTDSRKANPPESGTGISDNVQRTPATKPKPGTSNTKRVGALETKVGTLESQVKRLQNQEKAILHLDNFRDTVMARAEGWEKAIIALGTAYAIAAANHTKGVEEKKKVDAIESQIMFSVLTVASAGALSWISGAAQAAKEISDERQLLIDVLEDTVQAAGGEVFSANGPGISQRLPKPPQLAVSDDPLVFQNQRLLRLKTVKQSAYLFFQSMSSALLSTPAEQWDTYNEADQQAKYAVWLKQADLLHDDAGLPSIKEMADELERGFWAQWAPRLLTWDVVGSKAGITRTPNYSSPGSAIEKRWDELGITKASGVGDFGWYTTDSEIQQVIDWAKGYQVKTFL